MVTGFFAFEFLFEWITAEANTLFTNHSHTDFAEPTEISRVTEWLNTPDIWAMATGEGRPFGDLTPWAD